MKSISRLLTGLLLFCLTVTGFPIATHAGTSVFVSILPQKYFVEKIGGDLVNVSVMVMPGASPATYEPSPKQMAQLSTASAYFSIGVPFENTWLHRIAGANKSMPVIHTDKGITKRPMQTGHGHENETGNHDHGHGILDPHVWLAPDLVQIIARNIYAALVGLDPANKSVYTKNYAKFMAEIARLDSDILQQIDSLPKDKRSFMVFHPSWGYFAHQYGLQQIPIESEGKSPSPRDLAEIIRIGRELKVPAVFVQPQFSEKSAKVIAHEIGANVVPLNPLAEDWENNLRTAAKAFRKALQ
ncbi:metal ABC transporter solute-binding protein, Zn/Mn family [uncultured Pseudodesulfovibrio sp.]|uniref:metal ABC transporter solute-binding protein, Zn/Mn family n=1 Tax=uncultured Pseudodesulfovibrio sp. TaxID=2035858 RepID=UPI0029C77FDF|nr:zinc ABC transporter substrate-binding protein [uncultured Pseudodesulfovibrio sp.]